VNGGLRCISFEKQSFLGGKAGSWQFESKGEYIENLRWVSRFFRQYLNLRNFLKKIGAYKHLIPIQDYTILFDKNKKQGFREVWTVHRYLMFWTPEIWNRELENLYQPSWDSFY
jgi:uncharacterized protein with NAD-binding domain and iron-sulfur cluster